jgi:flavodoxin
LGNKKIVLFGTAGFGGSESYYKSMLDEIKNLISESNEIIDSFMCQGKMPEGVLMRYQKLLKNQPEDSNILNMISNYNSALSHLDENDIENVKAFVKKILLKI